MKAVERFFSLVAGAGKKFGTLSDSAAWLARLGTIVDPAKKYSPFTTRSELRARRPTLKSRSR